MDLTLDKIVENKLFIGDRKADSNPKTRGYWLDIKNDMVILDPEKIKGQLEAAKAKVDKAINNNDEILIVSDKTLIKDEVRDIATKNWLHFVNYRVPSGVLTNFETVKTRIKAMNKLKKFVASDKYKKLTKKEQILKVRKLNKLEKIYNGMQNLKKKPDLVIVLDGNILSGAVAEVEKLWLENIVVANSSFNKWIDSTLVMSNVNSYESLTFILKYLLS